MLVGGPEHSYPVFRLKLNPLLSYLLWKVLLELPDELFVNVVLVGVFDDSFRPADRTVVLKGDLQMNSAFGAEDVLARKSNWPPGDCGADWACIVPVIDLRRYPNDFFRHLCAYGFCHSF